MFYWLANFEGSSFENIGASAHRVCVEYGRTFRSRRSRAFRVSDSVCQCVYLLIIIAYDSASHPPHSETVCRERRVRLGVDMGLILSSLHTYKILTKDAESSSSSLTSLTQISIPRNVSTTTEECSQYCHGRRLSSSHCISGLINDIL